MVVAPCFQLCGPERFLSVRNSVTMCAPISPLKAQWLSFLAPLLSVLSIVASCNGAAKAAHRPNVVVILADDLGYGDVQCNNPERGKIPTPNIDRLAAAGLRFTNGHSSSGVCSPSRYTLLTGRYHWRTRLQQGIVGTWGPPLIAPERLTIAKLLQQQGYATACIGKWHLGWDWPIEPGKKPLFLGAKNADVAVTEEHLKAWKQTFSQPIPGGPITRGFDVYFGTDVPNWPPYVFIRNDRVQGVSTEFLPPRLLRNNQASVQGPALKDWTLEPILPALAREATAFIAKSSQEKKPYLLYMPLTTPHTPLAVNAAWRGKSGLNEYADLVMETDSVVGDVLSAIDASGTANNTLVLFTSDNGCAPYIDVAGLESKAHYPSGPLRGYKSDAWEGGHRVPLIVRWPAVVQPGVNHQLVHHADVIRTVADLVGATLPENAGEDSFSFLPILKGRDIPTRPDTISQSSGGLIAIQRGPWKLIFGKGSGGWGKGSDDQPAQLYNLEQDLAELKNQYELQPSMVAELTALMERIVNNGRSTPGPTQPNDQPFNWRKFLERQTGS